jgi:purine-nucleoside phosphorylase
LPTDVVPRASPSLVRALQRTARAHGLTVPAGPVWTIDGVFRELASKVRRYAAQGVLAVEMEAAALLAVAQFHRVEAALIVAMSDELFHSWQPGFHAVEFEQDIRLALDVALDAAAHLL